MKFERGKSPKDAMGIGIKESIKNMGGIVLERSKDFYWNAKDGSQAITGGQEKVRKATIIVVYEANNEFSLAKNRFGDLVIGHMQELPDYIEKWEKEYQEWKKIPEIDLKLKTTYVKGGSKIKFPTSGFIVLPPSMIRITGGSGL